MERRFAWFIILTAAASLAVHNVAANSSFEEPAPVVRLKLSDLRSAYLLRAGVVRYDATHNTAEGIRAQLQQHFNTVIGLLLVATPNSIDVALARLEAADDHSWSYDERTEWRKNLVAARIKQLQRLAFYRDRGSFPQNEGQADSAVPIFVDHHDTACAVGQLMRWSGWLHEVEKVRDATNLVYIPDVLAGDISQWVLTSGLTKEEAALVQPGYPQYVPYSFSDYGPGGPSFTNGGVRYSNFELAAENYSANATTIHNLCATSSCTVPTLLQQGTITPQAGGTLPSASSVGFSVGTTYSFSPGGLYPIGTDWIIFGGNSLFPNPNYDRGIHGSAAAGSAQKIVIQFDVSPVGANTALTQLTEHSNYFGGSFYSLVSRSPVPATGDALYSMTSHVLSNNSEIALATLDRTTPSNPNFGNERIKTIDFSPASSIHMQTELWLVNGVGIDSFGLDFAVTNVPEPCSSYLIFPVLMALTVIRRNPTRRMCSNFYLRNT